MKNLFVGNMSFQTTESDLATLFKGSGRLHGFTYRQIGRLAEHAVLLSWKCLTMKKRSRRWLVWMEKSSVAAVLT